MRTPYRLPLQSGAQSFYVRLGGVRYFLSLRFNAAVGCWMLSIADESKTPILSSIPVVTGLDLLAPYRYTGIAGSLVVQTVHDPDAVPTYTNLGTEGNIYYIVTS